MATGALATIAAMVGGMARFDGRTVMVIGHQKGRDARENVKRNWGMPKPGGYRKALRLFQHAEKFGFPILTFIDTPGADPGIESEERGQGNAIAENILVMAGLKMPIVAIVIGEGGSGGALAIGVADRLIMLEHSVYSVASPEGTAAILWRDSSKAPEAARAMKITAQDLLALKIADAIVPEPEGGAHTDAETIIAALGDVISAAAGRAVAARSRHSAGSALRQISRDRPLPGRPAQPLRPRLKRMHPHPLSHLFRNLHNNDRWPQSL